MYNIDEINFRLNQVAGAAEENMQRINEAYFKLGELEEQHIQINQTIHRLRDEISQAMGEQYRLRDELEQLQRNLQEAVWYLESQQR